MEKREARKEVKKRIGGKPLAMISLCITVANTIWFVSSVFWVRGDAPMVDRGTAMGMFACICMVALLATFLYFLDGIFCLVKSIRKIDPGLNAILFAVTFLAWGPWVALLSMSTLDVEPLFAVIFAPCMAFCFASPVLEAVAVVRHLKQRKRILLSVMTEEGADASI